MKIFGIQFGGDKAPQLTSEPVRQSFATPLGTIGKGDITKPYINSSYTGIDTWVSFNTSASFDNMFPQIIDQMYYQSPLHKSIIDYKINSTIGGGWTIENGDETGKGKVDMLSFTKKNKIDKLVKSITRDVVMHKRAHILIYKDALGNCIRLERVLPQKVRYNKGATKFWISDDWAYQNNIKCYPEFRYNSREEISVLSFIDLDSCPGQDVYPLPAETSCFNWCYLDGQLSNLHKENIQRSIFASIIIKRPKEFESNEEFDAFKRGIVEKEGHVSPVILLTSNGMENMPQFESFPTSNNDKLFLQTDERTDNRICAAHMIDPLLMGIRVSGKMGSGTDIKEAYNIYQKVVVMPLRLDIESIFDDIFMIFGIKGDFKLNEYNIINDVIVEKK